MDHNPKKKRPRSHLAAEPTPAISAGPHPIHSPSLSSSAILAEHTRRPSGGHPSGQALFVSMKPSTRNAQDVTISPSRIAFIARVLRANLVSIFSSTQF